VRKKERTRSARRFCFRRRRRRRKNERGAREKNERTHLDVSLERLDRFLAFDDHHVILSSFFARLDRLSLAREEDPSFPVKRSPVLSLSGEKNEQQKHAKESLRESLRERQERERERDKRERERQREREKREVLVKAFYFFGLVGQSLSSPSSVVAFPSSLPSAFCVFALSFYPKISLFSISKRTYPHTSRRAVLVRERTDTHTHFLICFIFARARSYLKKNIFSE